jgi:hypothetical protein
MNKPLVQAAAAAAATTAAAAGAAEGTDPFAFI